MQTKLIFISLSLLFLNTFSALGSETVNNQTLALIINKDDPASVETGQFYKKLRAIPEKNIIYISIKKPRSSITPGEFNKIYRQVQKQTDTEIQAYALAWSKPYKVGCMSITSAFSLSYNKQYCATGCKTTKTIDYYNSNSRQPFNDYKIRPSMMLAGSNIENIRKTLSKGVQADYSHPAGTAYLLSTSDKNRSVRSAIFPQIIKQLSSIINTEVVHENFIEDKKDVMFYFTGNTYVKKLSSNHFLAGAAADHLTSTGGVLFGKYQMSILKWLDAGATASYGTVVEPCNFLAKFSNPGILMSHYLNGNTILEAYWKSVAMPGQGVFVGEPLSSPYKSCRIKMNALGVFSFFQSKPGNYVLRSSTRC